MNVQRKILKPRGVGAIQRSNFDLPAQLCLCGGELFDAFDRTAARGIDGMDDVQDFHYL